MIIIHEIQTNVMVPPRCVAKLNPEAVKWRKRTRESRNYTDYQVLHCCKKAKYRIGSGTYCGGHAGIKAVDLLLKAQRRMKIFRG